MSLLVKGKLKDQWLETQTRNGEYVRKDSQFRDWIGPNGRFPAEAGRYHLYVSLACPWAHRTLIFRKLKQLEDIISVSVVHPHMGPEGWKFAEYPGSTPDTINGFTFLHQAYTLAQADYTGIVTVPALWDKKLQTIVNNESSEIIRMFNSAFDSISGHTLDFYPSALHKQIQSINNTVYHQINNGVYRCGFARSQSAYAKAFDALFDALDRLENTLAQQRYLVGSRLTEADWRLFPTLVRFDPVYVGHFKCNRQRIADYPNLSHYLRDLYQMPGIGDTVNLDHIKRHYYGSHESINPTGIVPKGPRLDWDRPHDRNRLN